MNNGILGFPRGGGAAIPFDPALLAGWIGGLVPSNSVADPTNDVGFTAGSAVDSTGKHLIMLPMGVTRQLDAPFGAGDGGLAASLTKQPSTWYHAFAVLTALGVPSVGFDTSVAAANLVNDHRISAYRRIGSVLTDSGGAITPFFAIEDAGGGLTVLWKTLKQDVAPTTQGSTAVLRVLSTPPGVRTRADLHYSVVSPIATNGLWSHYISSPDQDNQAISGNQTVQFSAGVSGIHSGTWQIQIWTDANSQIRTRSNATSNPDTIGIFTRGFFDPRR